MSALRDTNAPTPTEKTVVAILVSDIHLSAKPPVFRSSEPDWEAAMARPLTEVSELAKRLDAIVIVAGDIFDDGWRQHRCPPSLLNFAIRHLPKCYAIPGQHDLPNHRLEAIKDSAFWNLVEAGVITYLEPGTSVEVGELRLWGFPWGVDVTPLPPSSSLLLEVAVIHAYIWKKGSGFHGATEETRLKAWRKKLQGYDVAHFGDNHLGFLSEGETQTIFNAGGFLRRKSDERTYEPMVGLLHNNGKVALHKLDCSKDVYLDAQRLGDNAGDGIDLTDFLAELNALGDAAVDFGQALRHFMDQENVPEAVRGIVTKALGKPT